MVEYDKYCLFKIEEVLNGKRAPYCERAQECKTLEGAIVEHTTGITYQVLPAKLLLSFLKAS